MFINLLFFSRPMVNRERERDTRQNELTYFYRLYFVMCAHILFHSAENTIKALVFSQGFHTFFLSIFIYYIVHRREKDFSCFDTSASCSPSLAQSYAILSQKKKLISMKQMVELQWSLRKGAIHPTHIQHVVDGVSMTIEGRKKNSLSLFSFSCFRQSRQALTVPFKTLQCISNNNLSFNFDIDVLDCIRIAWLFFQQWSSTLEKGH